MKKILKQDAEKYWWYRMIKILYILAIAICGIIAFSLIKDSEYGYFPKTNFWASSYGYQCTKGSRFVGGNFPSSYIDFDATKGKNQIYTLNDFGISNLTYSNIMSSDDILKKVCFINGKVSDKESLIAQPVPSDSQSAYKFIMTEEVKDKTWSDFFWQWLVVLFWIFVVVKIIPRVFNYIAFGKDSNTEPRYKNMIEILDEVIKNKKDTEKNLNENTTEESDDDMTVRWIGEALTESIKKENDLKKKYKGYDDKLSYNENLKEYLKSKTKN